MQETQAQEMATVADAGSQPQFIGTLTALKRVNENIIQARKARQMQAEKARSQKLARTREGREQLAAEQAKRLREFERARREANLAAGRSAATEENKQKRALRLAAEVEEAQRKKADQAAQCRGAK